MVDTLQIYDTLKTAELPERHARAVTAAIKMAESETALDVKTVLERGLAELRAELYRNFVTKAEFYEKLAETKADLMRWMFIFWIGQVAAMVAIVKLWK